MASQYYCGSQRRRNLIRSEDPVVHNGIDYLEVVDLDYLSIMPGDVAGQNERRQRTLLVRTIHDAPATIAAEHVRIDGGVRIAGVRVLWARRADHVDEGGLTPALTSAELGYIGALDELSKVIVVRTDAAGDFSTYRLSLVASAFDTDPYPGFDEQLSSLPFTFKVECPNPFDCRTDNDCPAPEQVEEPLIDYLTKDYDSFRRLMLDRLSVLLPDWAERSPADVGVALVEVMAYAADYLSYYQDAVATEAYLGTARRRVSVRRHARLLNYPMHDGRNARAWVQIAVDAVNVIVPKGTALVTKSLGLGVSIPGSSTAATEDLIAAAVSEGARVFETLEEAALFDAHNRIELYTWGNESCCLPKGATRATLRDDEVNRLLLHAGDVIVFEEVRGAATGLEADADPTHRHAVRLVRVSPEAVRSTVDGHEVRTEAPIARDPVTGEAVVEIEWHAEDALPFPLCVSAVVPGGLAENLTVASSNIVPADQGWTRDDEDALDPAVVPVTGTYRPALRGTSITQALPYDAEEARSAPAAAFQRLRMDEAEPAVRLEAEGDTWIARRDLLNSDRFADEFVVELEDDGTAALRFGEDTHGRRPSAGTRFTTRFRTGNGRGGNVGAGSITHAMIKQMSITGVRNPLPAEGGTDPEPIEQVRLYAPQAFHRQERAVLVADYATMAERHPEVQKAQATMRWTGSWHTLFVTIDRVGGRPVDDEFRAGMANFLDRYRMIDRDLEITAPRFVPLEIELEVCVAPGYYRSPVRSALMRLLSNRVQRDGTLGFFHPDNLTFNQPVYLSRIVTAMTDVPGVQRVRVTTFKRWGDAPNGELDAGVIDIGRLEIARLDNDPSAPEHGQLTLTMMGGL